MFQTCNVVNRGSEHINTPTGRVVMATDRAQRRVSYGRALFQIARTRERVRACVRVQLHVPAELSLLATAAQ